MQAYIILTRAAISVNRILRRPTQAIVSDPALRCFVPMYRDSSMTMQTQGLPLRLASCFWSFVSSFLHLLRRGHPHQVQAAGQDYLRRLYQLQPRRRLRLVRRHHAAMLIKQMEYGG